MRKSAQVVVVLSFLAAGLAIAPASAEDGYRHGRIHLIQPGVTLQRATEVGAEEAEANLPFLPGDRIWTDESGRAEFQFPDGTVVRLDRRSKLDYAGHEEGQEERIVLRLWSGSLVLRVRSRDVTRFEVETPGGIVRSVDQGVCRLDVGAGEAHVAVYEGEAALDDGRDRVRVRAGEQSWARWGERAAEPQAFDRDQGDDFTQWDNEQEAREARTANSQRYLPDELDAYAGDLDQNGAWSYQTDVGYVWAPYVAAGWRPYWNGHWEWTPYGWTWVPYETWGWAPFHYGRWDFTTSLGWYWIPGRVWGPGWVSWAVGGGYVGWSPLGRHDRPIRAWGGHQGFAVPRNSAPSRIHGGPKEAWTFVRSGDLGRRDAVRRHAATEGLDAIGLRVAESAYLRPTRDGRGVSPAEVTPRAIRTRPTPGDYVRELAVDNQTTIPSPWLRRPGTVPRSEDIPRYQQGSTAERGGSAEPATGRVSRAPQGGQETGRHTSTPYSARPVTPTTGQPRLGGDGEPANGTRSGASTDGSRSTGGNGQGRSPAPQAVPRDSGGARGTRGGGESDRPRSSGGGYRPPAGSGTRSGGGSHPASQSPAQSKPSSGGGGHSSSDHAQARHNR